MVKDDISAISKSIEKEARRAEHNREIKITHDLINSYVQRIGRLKYLFKHDGEYQLISNNAVTYEQRIGNLVGRIDPGEEIPSEFVIKIGHLDDLTTMSDGTKFKLIMPVEEAITIFIKNGCVQYRAGDEIYQILKERASQFVKMVNPDEFISPVDIGKRVAAEIIGMNMPVDDDLSPQEVLKEVSGEEPVPANNIFPGLGGVELASEPFAQAEGRLDNQYPTNIYFYLSTPQQSSPCLDLVIVCVDEQWGDNRIGTFNLKVGYSNKLNEWKQDVKAIGRKIIRVLREQNMTDSIDVFKAHHKNQ